MSVFFLIYLGFKLSKELLFQLTRFFSKFHIFWSLSVFKYFLLLAYFCGFFKACHSYCLYLVCEVLLSNTIIYFWHFSLSIKFRFYSLSLSLRCLYLSLGLADRVPLTSICAVSQGFFSILWLGCHVDTPSCPRFSWYLWKEPLLSDVHCFFKLLGFTSFFSSEMFHISWVQQCNKML